MITRFFFEEIREPDKQLLEKYFQEKKIGRLEKLLQHGNFELAKFSVNVKYHRRHDTFIARLGLNFGREDFRSEEKGHTPLESFDLAFDSIVNQLRKTESKRHGD